MTSRPAANSPASIHGRLLVHARHSGLDFQAALVRFGNERLLARIAASEHGHRFVLKGATLFALWAATPHRPTRDLDLHGYGANAPEEMAAVFRAVCEVVPSEFDGLVFHRDTVAAALIREHQHYRGVRVTLLATLGKARIALQVDVGFGDAIFPSPTILPVPSMLGLAASPWPAYCRETVVAEKFQALVLLGMANSRMKDFFDLWTLQREFSFQAQVLAEAIAQTFARRTTALPASPPLALTSTFCEDATKVAQWRAFLNKTKLQAPDLPGVVASLERFLMPVATPGSTSREGHWPPGGPWQAG